MQEIKISKEFWKNWKRKTLLEKSAIKSLKSVIKKLLNEFPKKQIIALYVKGSFVRREMKKNSDVDMTMILKEGNYLPKLRVLMKKYEESSKPKVSIVGYSLWELKTGKLSKQKWGGRMRPVRVVKHLLHYRQVYGQKLHQQDLSQIEDKALLEITIKAFNERFILKYEQKKMWFSELVKQVFWLVELDEKVRRNNPPHSWRGLVKSIKNKDHIIHDTLKYRNKKPKDQRLRREYIKKLKQYLKSLKKSK